ncbi:MAG: TPM domain-containing protein [Phycisphaerae bacterium]|nr:TPM domain-containing protein [Phycisphaerae bacterium]
MPRKLSVPTRVAAALICIAIWVPAAMGEGIIKALPRPGDREFVRDLADMLSAEDEQEIRTLCDELLTAKATPIIVVTIKSMSDHGGRGMRIETFARLLFDQWEVGIAKVNGKSWNTGILLLVSEGDRKARIELGAGWKREKDDLCSEIMNELIIPKFKDGDFPGGIIVGVQALDKMARDLEISKAARPMWHYLVMIGGIGLAIFTAVSLYKRGSSGWAWLFWGLAFTVVGMLLYNMLRSSGDGDGFGGGAFGGGSSGGGGATGSW